MRAWFHGLKVAHKLMLISIIFIIPDSVMLYLFITGVNGHIEFARSEKRGNEYQRPLEALLKLIPEHRHLADEIVHGRTPSDDKLIAKQQQIDHAFDELEAVDARIGADLQFTDAGLAKRKREHYRAHTLRGEWTALRQRLQSAPHADTAAAHRHLVADLRMMITHSGDLSNLILDPDLDSYYLMDATLLALPQTQDRLAQGIDHGQEILDRGVLTEDDRRQLHTYANLLEEADVQRTAASLRAALTEDPNFYGSSPTLQSRVPPALDRYLARNEEFVALNNRLVNAPEGDIQAKDYVEAGRLAREASFELWAVAVEEMDRLLDTRIAAFKSKRAKSLLVAALAALAACGFVTFITRSISGPLRQQALELQQANGALEAEVAERTRAEAGLRESEAQLAAAQSIARIGSWGWDAATNKLSWSDENFRIHGLKPHEVEITSDLALHLVHPADREMSEALYRQAAKDGTPFSIEQRILWRDGTERILHKRCEVIHDAKGRVAEIYGTAQDITERKQAEAALEAAHRELLDVSRRAGMAEVATGVLHNVGNVLNSVNVSAQVISDRLSKSRVAHLANVSTMLHEHRADLGQFLTSDPKGQRLPAFIATLAERLTNEQAELLREAEGLSRNIAHIKDIVAVQQNYAKVSGVTESLPAAALVEDALEMNGAAFDRHGVDVVRNFEDVPLVTVERHKVLQILINLIRNAKYAVSESARLDKEMTVSIAKNGGNFVKITVADNGIGIPQENLARIFAHGFTTKQDGHGFGLHSSALAAKELGGSLFAHSAGPGQGASFTLELPMHVDSDA